LPHFPGTQKREAAAPKARSLGGVGNHIAALSEIESRLLGAKEEYSSKGIQLQTASYRRANQALLELALQLPVKGLAATRSLKSLFDNLDMPKAGREILSGSEFRGKLEELRIPKTLVDMTTRALSDKKARESILSPAGIGEIFARLSIILLEVVRGI
jgi:hypothetical protein